MRIGIAVDGSSPARAGVEFIASLPLSGGDHVTVISAASPPALLSTAPHGPASPVSDFFEEMAQMTEMRARQVAEHAVERLIGLPCPVTPIVRRGHPVEVLTRIARDEGLDLLVLGPRGLGGLGSILLGSVSHGLLNAMPTSILIARPPTGATRRVILAIDGSPASMAATKYLSRFPLPAGVDLHVLVSITPWTEEYSNPEAEDWLELTALQRVHAQEIAYDAVRFLEQQGRQCVPLIRYGEPKREIIDAALELDADLIVTGARGLGGFKGLFLGSVSRAVSKAAPCSVLVVGGSKVMPQPPDEEQLS